MNASPDHWFLWHTFPPLKESIVLELKCEDQGKTYVDIKRAEFQLQYFCTVESAIAQLNLFPRDQSIHLGDRSSREFFFKSLGILLWARFQKEERTLPGDLNESLQRWWFLHQLKWVVSRCACFLARQSLWWVGSLDMPFSQVLPVG